MGFSLKVGASLARRSGEPLTGELPEYRICSCAPSQACWRACHVGLALIITAIINGKNPPQLTAKKLMRLALQIPVDWTEQRKLLGFQ
jgi:hypothetical protein